MAMTKAEKAKMDELQHQLDLERAMRFTPPTNPDLVASGNCRGLISGWLILGVHDGMRVIPATSESHRHNRLNDDGSPTGCGTQGSRDLHSLRVDALRYMRNRVEDDASRRLAEIDRQIRAELQEPTPHPLHGKTKNG